MRFFDAKWLRKHICLKLDKPTLLSATRKQSLQKREHFNWSLCRYSNSPGLHNIAWRFAMQNIITSLAFTQNFLHYNNTSNHLPLCIYVVVIGKTHMFCQWLYCKLLFFYLTLLHAHKYSTVWHWQTVDSLINLHKKNLNELTFYKNKWTYSVPLVSVPFLLTFTHLHGP